MIKKSYPRCVRPAVRLSGRPSGHPAIRLSGYPVRPIRSVPLKVECAPSIRIRMYPYPSTVLSYPITLATIPPSSPSHRVQSTVDETKENTFNYTYNVFFFHIVRVNQSASECPLINILLNDLSKEQFTDVNFVSL